MGPQRIVFHQLVGHLACERWIQPSLYVDRRELRMLVDWVGSKFSSLALDIRLFRVCLRTDRNVFASSHRHCSSDQACDSGHQNVAISGICRCHSDNKARGGNDPVIGAKNGSSKPSNAIRSV
jgi:hypothetical protein